MTESAVAQQRALLEQSPSERTERGIGDEAVIDALLAVIERGRREEKVITDCTLPGAELDFQTLDSENNHPVVFRNCTFEGPISAVDADVTVPIHFRECEIDGLLVEGARFSFDFVVTDSVVTGEVDAFETRFEDRFDVSETVFEAPVVLDESQFGNEASFDGTTFESDASFKTASFSGASNELTDNASFVEATFAAEADFHQATFTYGDFANATFGGHAGFEEVTFTGDGAFPETTFRGGGGFRRDRFSGGRGLSRSGLRGEGGVPRRGVRRWCPLATGGRHVHRCRVPRRGELSGRPPAQRAPRLDHRRGPRHVPEHPVRRGREFRERDLRGGGRFRRSTVR